MRAGFQFLNLMVVAGRPPYQTKKMTFTVTYRSKDGALRDECVEAADRAACVAECRKRGIAPVKIAEGRSGKSAVSPKGRDKRGPSRDGGSPGQHRLTGKAAILAAVVLAAIAGGVWLWFGGRGATALPAERPAKHKVEKPKAEKPAKTKAEKPKTTSGQQQENVATNVAPVATSALDGVDMHRGKRVVSRTVETNKFRLVEWIVTDDGTRYKVMKDPPGAFKTGADQILAIALANMRDGRTAMMPGVSEKELQRAFKDATAQTVEILDTDSESVKELKRAVMDARKEMAAIVANGGSVTEALQEHLRLKGENAEVRRKCLAEYRTLLQEGKAEDAAEYLRSVNGQLQQLGIDELPASGRDRERPAAKNPPGNGKQ